MNDYEIPVGVGLEYNATVFHPITAVLILLAGALVFSPRRSHAILGFLIVCVFIPKMQRVVVLGLDFSMLRLIVSFAWIRVLARGEYRGFRRCRLDVVLVGWALALFIIATLRGGAGAVVYRLGVSFDILTTYFLFRALVRNREDVLSLWRQVAWIMIVLSPFLIYEQATLRNPFDIFGQAAEISTVRDGKVRCQGPFSHPILIGTFGSVNLAVFVGIFRGWKKHRALMAAAMLASTIITFASGSSGPIIALAVSLLGWGLWRVRGRVRVLIWCMVALALIVHLVREKPVWHLIGRLAEFTGGEGYFRYLLIDAFVNNFWEWALIGTDGSGYWGWGLWDTTSQYIDQGLAGGLLTFVLFIVVLRTCFVYLRATRIRSERAEHPGNPWALLAWGMSVSLASHCVSFVSVTYFGQIEQFFIMFVGLTPALAIAARTKKVARRAARSGATRSPSTQPSYHPASRHPAGSAPYVVSHTLK